MRKLVPSLYLLIPFLALAVEDPSFQTRQDSLLSRLNTAPSASEQIDIYRSLADMHRQQPEEATYLRKMAEVAQASQSYNALYQAWAVLSRYYYNEQHRDSLIYWVDRIDSLAMAREEMPDAFFDAKGFLCQFDLWDGNYELAMNEAIRLYNEAQKAKSDYGIVCSDENLGLIYQEINRDSDAVVAYSEGLAKLQQLGTRPAYEMQFMGNLAESYLKLGRLDELEKLLDRYKRMLKEREQENRREGKSFPVDRTRCMIYIFYAQMHTLQGEQEKALQYLDKARPMTSRVADDYVTFLYTYALAKYYYSEGNYEKTLQTLDEITGDYDLKSSLLRVTALEAVGRYKEALAFSRKIMDETNKRHDEAFTRQLNQLRTLHELNNQGAQAYELQLRNHQVKTQRRKLYISLVISLVLTVLLYILYRYYRAGRRFQRALIEEKNSLLESEKQLREAKEEAEHANQMKSAFIANISHEIRTPLNAIVGFSGLMAEDAIGPAEKEEFARLISNNSELLLNLINDVLDLSRIEAGNMKFDLTSTDLAVCCRNALDSVRHRLNAGVKLTYSPSEEPYELRTDPLRLQQLLVNLLVNAAKFTEKGEINLAYHIDQAKRQLCITVTDTGCGIPPDKQLLIFERFEKINEYSQGTGLGLSICRSIAEHLGGSITIDPSYTDGARFVFIHPLS